MTAIYLIRHAEAEGNLYRIAQGQHESSLTDRGWRQVRALERRFADIRIDAVYASDLYRTRATATAIYRPKHLPLHRCPGLREICVGDWEGRTWGDIARRTPEAMADFGSRMDRWAIPGAETPSEVLARVRATVEDIARANPGKTLALFSHGYAIRLLLANLQGISLRDTGEKSPTGDNTAVSLLEWDGERLRVVFMNDNGHLKTPEYLAGEQAVRRAYALEPGLWFRPLAGPESGGGRARPRRLPDPGGPFGRGGRGPAPHEPGNRADFPGLHPPGLPEAGPGRPAPGPGGAAYPGAGRGGAVRRRVPRRARRGVPPGLRLCPPRRRAGGGGPLAETHRL